MLYLSLFSLQLLRSLLFKLYLPLPASYLINLRIFLLWIEIVPYSIPSIILVFLLFIWLLYYYLLMLWFFWLCSLLFFLFLSSCYLLRAGIPSSFFFYFAFFTISFYRICLSTLMFSFLYISFPCFIRLLYSCLDFFIPTFSSFQSFFFLFISHI